MRIAIASGKGGTGKTTIATALALSPAGDDFTSPPIFVDCNFEAPNCSWNPSLKNSGRWNRCAVRILSYWLQS
jgi:MinD superfamily P-loop ATPase